MRRYGYVVLHLIAGLVIWFLPLSEMAAYVLGGAVGTLSIAWGVTRRPPPASFFAVAALGVAAVALAGCRDTRPALATAAVQREVGVAAGRVIHERCELPALRATTDEELDELERIGCPRAERALRALRAAHGATIAMIDAYDMGRCTSVVSQAPRECDITGALTGLVRAAQDVAIAVDRLGAP
jgi:hypothetical protein